jgi:hypothetical protein
MSQGLSMKGPTALFLFGIAAAGCARTYWTKPGFNQADWNRDSYECERDMRQSGYYGSGLIGALNAQDFQEPCLVAKGYYKSTPARSVANTPETPARSPKKAQIDALDQLRANGGITDDEFEAQRAKIIMSPDF